MAFVGEILAQATALMWVGALAAAPLALLVALLCRTRRLGPSTRHAMWVMVLVSFVTPGIAQLAGIRVALPELSSRAGHAGDTQPGVRTGTRTETQLRAADALGGGLGDGVLGTSFVHDSPVHAPVDDIEPLAWEAPRLNDAPRGGVSTFADAPFIAPAISTFADAPELVGVGGGADRAGGELARAADPELAHRVNQGLVAPPDPAAQEPGRTASRDGAALWLNEAGGAAARARDAIASIPPLPMPLWLGGIGVVVLIKLARCARFRGLLRSAELPDSETARLVSRVSREVGLRRAPETRIFERAISPLVWCGVRPVLVLPRGLWSELDRGARRAVLMHELAHLKRRDHIVMWAAQCVGVLYWWHPIAWWVRRRIDEEADLACDAWVTELQPVSRRAYAETLLMARSFVSTPGAAAAPGLAMASSRTKRFARRLKMVMTENRSPRLSLLGVAMAAGLAIAGAVVTPALACPEKDKEKASLAVEPEVALVSSEIVDLPEVAVLAETVGGSTFESFMAGQPEDDDLRELLNRLARLEAELAAIRAYVGDVEASGTTRSRSPRADVIAERNRQRQLEREVRAEAERADRREASRARADEARARAEDARARDLAAEAAARQQFQRQRAAEVEALRSRAAAERDDALARAAEMRARADADRARAEGEARARGLRGRGDGGPRGGVVDATPDEPQSYYLSNPGKLEDLTELMARSDVPVLIERHDEKIVVHGDAEVQRIFAAFVKMIDPDARVPRGTGRAPGAPGGGAGLGGAPAGLRGAPAAPAAPGLPGTGAGGGTLRRAPAPPTPPSAPSPRSGGRAAPVPDAAPEPAVMELRERDAVRRQRQQEVNVWRDQMSQLDAQRKSLKEQVRDIERRRQRMQMQADQTEVEAEEMESRVEELQVALEERLESIHDASGEKRKQIEGMVARMQVELADASSRTAMLMAHRAETEQQAEMLEQYVDSLEQQMEELDSHAEELEDRIAVLLEEIQEREDEVDRDRDRELRK